MFMRKLYCLGISLLLITGLAVVPVFAAGETEQGQSQSQSYGTSTSSQSMSSMKSGVHRASELIDKKVQNDQGEDLGKVKDVVLMGDRIRYVVLSRDGVLGMGGDMIPIPFTMISSANMSEDSIIVSNLDKDKLDKAPTVSEQDWENQLQNPSFESKVFGYYGEQQPSSSQMEQPSSSQMEQPSSMPSEGSESGMESSESESGFGSSPSPGSGSSSGTETGGSSGSGY